MGRVSKRKIAQRTLQEQYLAASHPVKRYQVGIYARLSSGRRDKTGGLAAGTESLGVQIEIAKRFVETFNREEMGERMDVVRCYTDLGKTGSNFEREGFRHLLQDIRGGEINCVIVKDLSRFGRNYLEAAHYIENIFPFLGVRFIAVSDGYDTGKEGNENMQMTFAIKNLVNDLYAKEFSKKAKLHLARRRAEGSYVGGPPPYGYVTKWNEKKRVLVPDDNTRGVVSFLFETFVKTESYTATAKLLNKRKINPPTVYKKTKEVYYTSDENDYKGWDKSAVKRILESATYTGTLVQGKTSMTARDEKNRIHKPEDEWVITKDAHVPLVSMERYQQAAKIREKITRKSTPVQTDGKGSK